MAQINIDWKVETRFEYKGYPCVVLFVRDHRCGYVGLPKGHKYYQKDYNEIDICCHGGLTYGRPFLVDFADDDTWWIGFDCNHYDDRIDIDSAKKYFKNEPELMEILRLREEVETTYPDSFATVKDLDYVMRECKDIVDQLEGDKDITQQAIDNFERDFVEPVRKEVFAKREKIKRGVIEDDE